MMIFVNMYCRHCGAQLNMTSSTVIYCSMCGTRYDAENIVESQTHEEPTVSLEKEYAFNGL